MITQYSSDSRDVGSRSKGGEERTEVVEESEKEDEARMRMTKLMMILSDMMRMRKKMTAKCRERKTQSEMRNQRKMGERG